MLISALSIGIFMHFGNVSDKESNIAVAQQNTQSGIHIFDVRRHRIDQTWE